jgi:hypothetical protein
MAPQSHSDKLDPHKQSQSSHRINKPLTTSQLRNITLHQLYTGSAVLPTVLHQSGIRVRPIVDKHQVRASHGEGLGQALADRASRAGNDGDFVGQGAAELERVDEGVYVIVDAWCELLAFRGRGLRLGHGLAGALEYPPFFTWGEGPGSAVFRALFANVVPRFSRSFEGW